MLAWVQLLSPSQDLPRWTRDRAVSEGSVVQAGILTHMWAIKGMLASFGCRWRHRSVGRHQTRRGKVGSKPPASMHAAQRLAASLQGTRPGRCDRWQRAE